MKLILNIIYIPCRLIGSGGISSRRPRIDLRPIERIVVEKVTLRHIFLQMFRFSRVSIISPMFRTHFPFTHLQRCGPGSVVGIATGYGLDGSGIEYRWGRYFPHLSRPNLGPTQPPVQWVPGLSRG